MPPSDKITIFVSYSDDATAHDNWMRVKSRLRSSVGEDVYSSWFALMDFDSLHDESVHLSVPTRFLKSWIQANYSERVLNCWQAEMPQVHQINLMVRSTIERDKELSVQDHWARVKGRLRSSVGEDVYSSWFASMDFESLQDNNVELSVPTRFLKRWIQDHYYNRLLSCLQAEIPQVHRINLTARTAMRRVAPTKEATPPIDQPHTERSDGPPAPELRPNAMATISAAHDALGGSPLDPRLTFGNFIIGRSNTLAHAAARLVAEGRRGESVRFKPLYFHASAGLGKTHLLQAVTWAGNSSTERKFLYLTAEKFMYGFAAALKTLAIRAFDKAFPGVDVLIIDDLQWLQGKTTQAEFCHTLNALLDANCQVVIAADRPPSDLESVDDDTRSRLAGGLMVEMGSLGEDLRLGILRSRVAAARVHHTNFNVPASVLDYLARTINRDGRALESAVNRLLDWSKLNATPVTLEMAERQVRELIRPQEPKLIEIEDIQRVVARQYDVSRSELLSSRRTANVVRPRQVAMYLSKTLTQRSLPEIGRRFGGRDHTTVLHAVRKIEYLITKDMTLAGQIVSVRKELENPVLVEPPLTKIWHAQPQAALGNVVVLQQVKAPTKSAFFEVIDDILNGSADLFEDETPSDLDSAG